MKKLLLVSLALALLASGCGRRSWPGYTYPRGKTLVYSVSTQTGYVDDKNADRLSDGIDVIEVRVKVSDMFKKDRKVTLSAMPPNNRDDIFRGRDLGSVDIEVGKSGVNRILVGSQIPTEIKYFIPELPLKLRKGDKWTDTMPFKFYSVKKKLKLEHEFLGRKKFQGQKCLLLRGKSKTKVSLDVKDEAQEVNANIFLDYKYEEDYCFDKKGGYPKLVVMKERRLSKIKDLDNNTIVGGKIDLKTTTIALEKIL